MNDTNSNEGQLPEDAAVTVTSADALRAMESYSHEDPWNVAGERRTDRGKHQ